MASAEGENGAVGPREADGASAGHAVSSGLGAAIVVAVASAHGQGGTGGLTMAWSYDTGMMSLAAVRSGLVNDAPDADLYQVCTPARDSDEAEWLQDAAADCVQILARRAKTYLPHGTLRAVVNNGLGDVQGVGVLTVIVTITAD